MQELVTSRALRHHNPDLRFQAPDVINGLAGRLEQKEHWSLNGFYHIISIITQHLHNQLKIFLLDE